jgi:hypothetical protein
VAALNLGRGFVGIDSDKKQIRAADKRLRERMDNG